ncbi:MAG TPA: DUF6079 family protein [Armatimonadota bacterium]|jgi:hypothetical protein
MTALPLHHYLTLRAFPPVVHPRHAREILATPARETLADWVGGYAVTVPEHRQLLEDLLASFAWKTHGQAVLVHGLYGTGKSHLLVLLHLLLTLPDAWSPFLDAHPTFGRYGTAIRSHRRLLVHFSLDEYRAHHPLERTIGHAVTRALEEAGIAVPDAWGSALSRREAWAALLESCRAQGYDGVVLCIDELSLFLAGKTPAKREADAAFLQCLADLTQRAPLWLIGAVQRQLAATGALSTHSWRQVEDRFRRYALTPQAMGEVLREKLFLRRDPAALRAAVMTTVVPQAAALALDLSPGALHHHWPFHPAALALLSEVANAHLSPHRSVVEVLQRLGDTGWLARAADCLITPDELGLLIAQDLQGDERLAPLWAAETTLRSGIANAEQPALASAALTVLLLQHLAGRSVTVAGLRTLLFDGQTAPTVAELSGALQHLRRTSAYLSVTRAADPADEVFAITVDDDCGVQAWARMQEVQRDFTAHDPRIIETALRAEEQDEWPLADALSGRSLAIPWHGGERVIHLVLPQQLTRERCAADFEALCAGHADGQLTLAWPGDTAAATRWQESLAALAGAQCGVYACCFPRPLSPEEWGLLREFAAWQGAANPAEPTSAAHERQLRRRCHERAEELRPAVSQLLRALYLEGECVLANGETARLRTAESLALAVAPPFAAGFARLFPLLGALSAENLPSHLASQQLLQHVIAPGAVPAAPYSVLIEQIERFLLPLGCASWEGEKIRVVPPCREILDPLLNQLEHGPLRVTEALSALRRPPLGLTGEQGKLAVAAALCGGAVQGLDGFLHPVETRTAGGALLDTVVFLALPHVIDERYRPQLLELAAYWQLPLAPWALLCTQAERQWHAWLADMQHETPAICAMSEAWSEFADVLPWGWRESEALLRQLNEWAGREGFTVAHALEAAGDGLCALVQSGTTLRDAVRWWEDRLPALRTLHGNALPPELAAPVEAMRQALVAGEQTLPTLAALGAQLDEAMAQYTTRYRRWHEDTFGTAVVTALRDAFDHPDFRAVKRLSQLPLPVPDAAQACLAALALARTAYCAGDFTSLVTHGCCARCGKSWGSPSPMPVAAHIRDEATAALRAFAAVLATHPWAATVRARRERAPDAMATRADALLNWRADDGATALLTLLDDEFLAWLCREAEVTSERQTEGITRGLHGRDLTVREARTLLEQWLDPEQALAEESVLRFT